MIWRACDMMWGWEEGSLIFLLSFILSLLPFLARWVPSKQGEESLRDSPHMFLPVMVCLTLGSWTTPEVISKVLRWRRDGFDSHSLQIPALAAITTNLGNSRNNASKFWGMCRVDRQYLRLFHIFSFQSGSQSPSISITHPNDGSEKLWLSDLRMSSIENLSLCGLEVGIPNKYEQSMLLRL